jgi:HlyD family secretion protein
MRRRHLAYLAAALAVAGAFWWAFRPQPVPVDLAVIARGVVEATVDEEGVTRIRDVYTVSAPVAGQVLRTEQEAGDAVRAHESVVAVLRPQAPAILDRRTRAELEASLSAAEAALGLARAERSRAEAELAYWRGQLRRDQMLIERAAIPEIQLEQTRLELATREAALESARALVTVRERERDRAQAALIEPEDDGAGGDGCCVRVHAPVSGRVLTVIVESEQVIPAGAPLLTIGDPADLEIVVDLLSADAVRIAEGAEVRIERWGGPQALAARVRRIEPAGFEDVSALGIEEQRVRAILDIESPPEDWRGLGHGFRVFARLLAARRADVPLIPMAALFRDGSAWAAFAAQDGVARLRRVEIGVRNGEAAEILSGLSEGDAVILHPSDRVAEGVAIADRAALTAE